MSEVTARRSFRVAADWREEQSFADFTSHQARAQGLSTQLKEIDNPGRFWSFTAHGKLPFTPSDGARALLTVSHSDAYAAQAIQVMRLFEDHVASFPHSHASTLAPMWRLPMPTFGSAAD